jgi:AcrR family transcriptional regulator
MSIPYELTGRTQQKARTRRALAEAARSLLVQGTSPTVEQAADAAGISRTTAYRYFPNQRALLAATFPELEAASLLKDPPPEDPSERLDAFAEALTSHVIEHEPELRAQLRMSLEHEHAGDLPLRSGRAIGWVEDALAPVRERLGEREFRRLVLAIRATLGIEALTWLTDIAGLSRAEATRLMRWSAQALLRAALAEQSAAAR